MSTKPEADLYDDLGLADRMTYAMVPKATYDISASRLSRLRMASLVVLIGVPVLSILMAVLIAYDDAAWTDNIFVVAAVFLLTGILAASVYAVFFDKFGRRILQITLWSFSLMERQRWAKGAEGKARLSKVMPNEWEVQTVKDACLWSYSRVLIAVFAIFATSHLVFIGLDLFLPETSFLKPIFTVKLIPGLGITICYMMVVLPIVRIVWTLPSLDEE